MNDKELEKFERMTKTPVEKLICTLAVPTILSMLVTSFYNMADTYFVGKIGTSATAAVGVVFSLMAFIQACGFFFGHGSGNYMSRLLGCQEHEEAERVASTGFFSALLAGVLIAAAGLLLQEPLARLLGSTDTILPYSLSYMRIILLGTPFMTGSLALNNQLRFQGSASYAMVGIISGAVLNIILDPVLIFVFDMGIAGAAWATVIGQITGFCLLLWATARGGNIRMHFRNFSPSASRYKTIFAGGAPSLCRQGIGSVGTIALNLAAGVYGDAAIAAMSIVSRIVMFAASVMIGFGQGFQPVCGFNYGAKQYDRVKKAFWFCVKTSVSFLVIAAALGIWQAPRLIRIFRKDDAEVLAFGITALRLQWLTFPLFSWVTMSNMMLQTIGKAGKASFLAMARQGIFFLPLILVLPYFLGSFGVQLAQPIADILTFGVAIPLQLSVLRELGADKA